MTSFEVRGTPSLPPRQARRCRRRFRTTTSGRTRTPSIGSRPSLAVRGGLHHAHCSLARLHPGTMSLAASPATERNRDPVRWRCRPRQRLAGRLELPRAPRGLPYRCRHVCPRDAARKMLLSDFCNRPTLRAPADCPTPVLHARSESVLRRVTASRGRLIPGRNRRREVGSCSRAFRNEPTRWSFA